MTTLLCVAIDAVFRFSGTTLDGSGALLGIEPFIDVGFSESPVLSDLSGGNSTALGKRVQGGSGNLQVDMKLIQGENVCFSGQHL